MTVKSLLAGTSKVQGVRQLGPSDVRASAPGGSESNRNGLPLGVRELRFGIQDVSKLGDQDEHPARTRALPSKTMTRVIIMMFSS